MGCNFSKIHVILCKNNWFSNFLLNSITKFLDHLLLLLQPKKSLINIFFSFKKFWNNYFLYSFFFWIIICYVRLLNLDNKWCSILFSILTPNNKVKDWITYNMSYIFKWHVIIHMIFYPFDNFKVFEFENLGIEQLQII